MNRIILFDLDGTLIDSTEAILESFSIAFETFGMKSPDAALIKAEVGHPLDDMMRSLGVAEAQVWDYVDAYKRHYQTVSCQKTILLPHAADAVQLAAEHAALGVVTTKTGKFSRELLEHLGLMHYFEVLIGREDVENPKPHPEPVLKALSQMQTDWNTCWMIGDTCMDMLSAKAANISAIGVSCGYGAHEVLLGCAEHLYPNALEAVRSIVQR